MTVIDPASQANFDAAIQGSAGPRHEVFGLSRTDGAILPGWTIDIADCKNPDGLRHFQTLIATQERLHVGADDRIFAFDFGK